MTDASVLQENLDREEVRIWAFLNEEMPEVANVFGKKLQAGRRGILQRVVQAVVRENIAGMGTRSVWQAERQELTIHLQSGQTLRIPVGARYSLGRFSLGEEALRVVSPSGEETILNHPVQVVDVLEVEGLASKQLCQFRLEIQNSSALLALSLAGGELRAQKFRHEAQSRGCYTALAYVEDRAAAEETFSPLVFFEQMVVEGHPLHPGAKIKLGLEMPDVLQYSPEWGAEPAVVPVAVRKDRCRFSSYAGQSPREVLMAEHAGLREAMNEALMVKGLCPDEYELLPVHPWQYDHTLPQFFQHALEAYVIVPLPEFRLKTQALMSFRSLAPVQARRAGAHHLKTAVNVQTTGAVRTVSPNSAHNGPLLSRLLETVQERESGLAGRFVILTETVGVYYHPAELEDPQLGKQLAAILRENPESYVQVGELAMPASAMLAVSPISGDVMIRELMEAYAVAQGARVVHEVVVAWMREYAETVLPGFLTLMSRYGIALEGHLQNSIVVFREGKPVRLIVRDFGGVRILRERIARQGLQAEFFPRSTTVIDDVQDLRNKIYYPVFQNHMGELILCIARCFQMEETPLWQVVTNVCRRVFAELKRGDGEFGQQAAEDEAVLLAPTLELKAMATMRILGDVTSYTFVRVPNPMTDFD